MTAQEKESAVTMAELKKKYPIEILRVMQLFALYREYRAGKKADPTAYNLQEMSKRTYASYTISQWISAAAKRGLVYQNHWYNDQATWELTMSGEMLMSEVISTGEKI